MGESVKDPLKYYENNVGGTVTLLQAMQKYKTKYFIFSSTAALFGIPDRCPIQATDATVPINPYGETKLVVEHMLKWCDAAFGLKFVTLRYFNACGASADGSIVMLANTGRRPLTRIAPDSNYSAGSIREARQGSDFRRRLQHTRWHLRS